MCILYIAHLSIVLHIFQKISKQFEYFKRIEEDDKY